MNLSPTDLLGLAQLLALGFVLAYALGVLNIFWTLTRPPRRRAGWAVARSLASDPGEMDVARYGLAARPFRSITVTHSGVRCPTWEIDGDDPEGPIAILTHGWNDGKVNALVRLEPFVKHCSLVIAWDLPGHGEANARCALGRTEHSVLNALLAQVLARSPRSVVLMGWSMGGGISLVSATTCPRVAAVICEAPYRLPQTPASRVLAARGMPGLGMLKVALTLIGGSKWQIPGGPFDRAMVAGKLRQRLPVLVLHGSDDPVCPAADAQSIAQAAEGRAIELPGARHNDLWTKPASREIAVRSVESLLSEIAVGRATRPTESAVNPPA